MPEIAEIDAEHHRGGALPEKNRTPPVASNWLIGAVPSNGWMINRCSTTPSPPTPLIATTARQQERHVISDEHEIHAVHARA